jgi:hypothetical protein
MEVIIWGGWFGTFFPNAQWTIAKYDTFDLRPMVLFNNIDSDGSELVFADRQNLICHAVSLYIPNDGDGSEPDTGNLVKVLL